MTIALNHVFSELNTTEEHEVSYEIQAMDRLGKTYPVHCPTPFHIVLKNLDFGKAKLSLQGQAVYELPCDRCLSVTKVTVEIDSDFEIFSPGAIPDEESAEEQDFVEESVLNTDALIQKEISLQWPMKVLCHEECKGICPVCGRNLNEGECGCDTFVPDPRLAKLKDIFNQKREV